MNELALFAGAGGGILGGHLLGWRTVCAVEIDPYPRNVLLARQDDGTLPPPFPVWDDVTTFDGKPWRGIVDVVSGGFPCQDISSAGAGKGIDGARSGLWREFARIIREVRPLYAFVENSPMLTSRGLGRVLGDLAEMGYNAAWGVLGASDLGAPHVRKRIWILGLDSKASCSGGGAGRGFFEPEGRAALAADSDMSRCKGSSSEPLCDKEKEPKPGDSCSSREVGTCWQVEPGLDRVADGVAYRMDRLKAIGNGQVPCVATAMFEHLRGILEGRNYKQR